MLWRDTGLKSLFPKIHSPPFMDEKSQGLAPPLPPYNGFLGFLGPQSSPIRPPRILPAGFLHSSSPKYPLSAGYASRKKFPDNSLGLLDFNHGFS
jgi:hypothetical protein